jgi:hypothetical protein
MHSLDIPTEGKPNCFDLKLALMGKLYKNPTHVKIDVLLLSSKGANTGNITKMKSFNIF